MTYEEEKLLRFWAAGPDDDQYRHVKYEFGYNQAKARREVRKVLRGIGWYPHTSDEFQEVRRRLRKGEIIDHQLT
jgi:hypothetical protein